MSGVEGAAKPGVWACEGQRVVDVGGRGQERSRPERKYVKRVCE